MQNTYIIRK